MKTMNELDKIKAKIKKLFALSKSPNANEAAIALEMAQKLMAEHSIERNAVGEFEVIEEEVKGNGGKKPPRYEVFLIGKITIAFGCKCAYGPIKIKPRQFFGCDYDFGYQFIGLEHRVKTASFIAEVLLRKVRKARTEYTKKLNRVCLRENKIKRADDFCLGWAFTVVSKLYEFTNTTDEQKAIDNYAANLSWTEGCATMDRGALRNSGMDDFGNGRRAAADVQIQHGVEGKESGALLLED
jgi:hypothetical protein